METFGDRLRKLRMARNLHQSQLGDILGLSPSAIGSYERNLREPAYKHLVDIANLFSVSVDYLLCRTEEPLTIQDHLKLRSYQLDKLLTDYDVLIGSYTLSPDDKTRLQDVATGLFWDKLN